MLFAISGSQGSGKSTVLQKLEEKGYPVVERKTSRSIMNEWGVTLGEINNDRPLTVKFQDEILLRKELDEHKAASDPSRIWFTERTYADLFTYALIAIGKDNEYSEWIDSYFVRCAELQKTYNHNFYLKGGLFTLEHDGVRGSNAHYSNMVDIVMKDVTSKMYQQLMNPTTFDYDGPATTVLAMSKLDARIFEILNSVSKHTKF